MKYAQDGNISDFEAEDIADAAGWEWKTEEFLNAMIDCGRGSKCSFIEKTEKGMFIHDWNNNGGIFEKKREQNCLRQQRFRKSHKIYRRNICPHCGAGIKSGENICSYCGMKL